jgi:hypothetical protein
MVVAPVLLLWFLRRKRSLRARTAEGGTGLHQHHARPRMVSQLPPRQEVQDGQPSHEQEGGSNEQIREAPAPR